MSDTTRHFDGISVMIVTLNYITLFYANYKKKHFLFTFCCSCPTRYFWGNIAPIHFAGIAGYFRFSVSCKNTVGYSSPRRWHTNSMYCVNFESINLHLNCYKKIQSTDCRGIDWAVLDLYRFSCLLFLYYFFTGSEDFFTVLS